jgi:hypothetical protein
VTTNDLAAPDSSAPSPRVARPLGLTFLAVVLAWFALQMPQVVLASHSNESWGVLLAARTIGVALGISAPAACVGLWKVLPWGFYAFVSWAVVLVVGGLLGSMASDPGASTGQRMAGLAVAATVLTPLAFYVKRRTDQVQASQYVKRTPYQAGRLEVIIGVMLLVPSVYVLRWLTTSPDARYLMIIGALLALGALLAAVVGVTLIVGGLWTAYELPGRRRAHVVPLVAGIGVAGYLLNQV